MQFDFNAMSQAARFAFLTGAVVPRPIALITTLGAKWYTRTSDLFSMERPVWSDWVVRARSSRKSLSPPTRATGFRLQQSPAE